MKNAEVFRRYCVTGRASATKIVGTFHEKVVFGRRARVIAEHLAGFIPQGARILDVGSGDGTIDHLILHRRPDVSIEGIDVLVRAYTRIPVRPFDGVTIPYPAGSFDVVMFVDVLHHTPDPTVLLSEAARVGKVILIKDHFRQGFLAGPTLRFMDWLGNAHFGVALPYNYWTRAQWTAALEALGLKASEVKMALGLYPLPASWFFDRDLQFVAQVEREVWIGASDCPEPEKISIDHGSSNAFIDGLK